MDRIFDRDVLMEETLSYARGLAANSSPLAMGVMKQQVYEAQESTHEDARLMAFRWWYDVMRVNGDFKEGVGSFVEREVTGYGLGAVVDLDRGALRQAARLEKRSSCRGVERRSPTRLPWQDRQRGDAE